MKRILTLLFLLCALKCNAEDLKYHFNNILSISISKDMEMRRDGDAYTKCIDDVLNCSTQEKIVFQQRGLASLDSAAMAHYARIIIKTFVDEEGGFPASNETDFSDEYIKELEDACADELMPGGSFVTKPVGRVEKDGNTVRICMNYRRTGLHGVVAVIVVYMFNYHYAAKIVASYREREGVLWEPVIERAVRSVEWDKPFVVESIYDTILEKESGPAGNANTEKNEVSLAIMLVGGILVVSAFLIYLICRTGFKRRDETRTFIGRILRRVGVSISKALDKVVDCGERKANITTKSERPLSMCADNKTIRTESVDDKCSRYSSEVQRTQKNFVELETEFSSDKRLSFDPKEHIYILDGFCRLKAISDIVANYFSPFNLLEQSKLFADKNGIDQCQIIEMWDANGAESRDVGTFLHEQIDNYLKGDKVLLECSVEYVGEFVNHQKVVSIETELGYFLNFLSDLKVKPFRSEWRIFDEGKKIAGTIDMICRNGDKFDIYDWKRSSKASPYETVWRKGINGLEDIPDTSFYRYALQQNLYRYILENNYYMSINKMYLVILHPQYANYIKYEVPRMDKQISAILKSL